MLSEILCERLRKYNYAIDGRRVEVKVNFNLWHYFRKKNNVILKGFISKRTITITHF